MGSSNWRNSCQGILDQLSEVVFLSVVYRNGMAVCTGISSAVSGSFTAGIWMVAGGRHHLHGRRGDLLLKMPMFNAKHKMFGTHEIFHLFVMGGSFCHFVVMYYFVAAMPV